MEYEHRRKQLFQALRTRPLTEAEFNEALSYGDDLNIEPCISYSPEIKSRELNDAFVTQQRLKYFTRLTPHAQEAV